jgi:hypothetical protein
MTAQQLTDPVWTDSALAMPGFNHVTLLAIVVIYLFFFTAFSSLTVFMHNHTRTYKQHYLLRMP